MTKLSILALCMALPIGLLIWYPDTSSVAPEDLVGHG